MPSPNVRCEVNTCTHWFAGNYCTAGNIDVLNEKEGQMPFAREHTECKTFSARRGLANMIGSLDNVNWAGLATGMILDGQQVTPTVTCIVNSCTYWENGNLCSADEISVSGRNAGECQDTYCHTFRNK